MEKPKGRIEENLNQLLETFNADDTELVAFLENPTNYLEKLGVKELSGLSAEEFRQMVQKSSHHDASEDGE